MGYIKANKQKYKIWENSNTKYLWKSIWGCSKTMSRKIRQFMDLPLLCHSESQNLHTLPPYVVAIPKFWIMGDEEKT